MRGKGVAMHHSSVSGACSLIQLILHNDDPLLTDTSWSSRNRNNSNHSSHGSVG